MIRSVFALKINRHKIRAAILWSIKHNAAYQRAFEKKELVISEENLALYSDKGEVPSAIIKKTLYTNEPEPNKKHKSQADAAGYILPANLEELFKYGDIKEPIWTYTGLADVNAFAMSPQLLQDIVNHRHKFKNCSVKPTLIIPSGSNASLFDQQPDIIHGCFPTLFPFGRGGPYDERKNKIAMPVYLMHLTRLADFRFRTHAPFVFALFSLAQRQRVSISASRSLKMNCFMDFQKDLKHITPDTLQHCIDDLKEAESNGEYPRLSHCKNDVARKAFGKMLNQLKVIGGRLPLTDAAKQTARFEALAMNFKLGIPDLFVTINPNDVHAPLVCHFGAQPQNPSNPQALDEDDNEEYSHQIPGEVPIIKKPLYTNELKLSLDDPDMPANILSALERKKMVCSDALAAVQFSHALLRAFIKSLLGFGSEGKLGFLGDVLGYHFNPEEQNRGSLHYHGIVWLAHKPDAATFRKRLGNADFQKQILLYLSEIIKHEAPAHWQSPADTTEFASVTDTANISNLKRHREYTALLQPENACSILHDCKQQLVNDDCKHCNAKHEQLVSTSMVKCHSVDQHIACRRIGDPSHPEFKNTALRDLTLMVDELVTHDVNHRTGCFKYQRRGKKSTNAKQQCRFHFPKELGTMPSFVTLF